MGGGRGPGRVMRARGRGRGREEAEGEGEGEGWVAVKVENETPRRACTPTPLHSMIMKETLESSSIEKQEGIGKARVSH